MSQIKFRYQESNPGESQPQAGNDVGGDELYPSGGGVRNICFVVPDGNLESFNYAFIVHKHCSVEGDLIIIEFTTHTVMIKGVHLKTLFFQIFQQLNKIISCTDERYNVLQGENTPIVNSILVTNN